jgi:hypothetical protein
MREQPESVWANAQHLLMFTQKKYASNVEAYFLLEID